MLLIKTLAMRPIAGVRITLISQQSLTPYSGMLPGYVAGHYSLEQTNIDLNRLCRRAGVRWINATATDVDPDLKLISLADQASVEFDKLSIDIGSTPDQRIRGAREHALGVKPIADFQRRWNTLLESAAVERPDGLATHSENWGVIGAGAGGVELVLAMAHRMRDQKNLHFHLVYQGEQVLPGYPSRVVSIAEKYLREAGVSMHANFKVKEILANGVLCQSGRHLGLEQSILCTGAIGAPWLANSPLACTDKNFIKVNQHLQSVSHASVFAVGDIAEMVDDPRPKAGVYAVRQAPFLAQNLRLIFAGKAMQKISLQTRFLSLLSLGNRVAIASRNGLVVSGAWVWRWKDSIDRKFMHQFSDLKMSMNMPPSSDFAKQGVEIMHCGGCGSKLGPAILMDNLNQLASLNAGESNNLEQAVAEDATVWNPSPNTLAVQSIDGFRSFTTDEYRFARICVNHAASDIQAMGATMTHALAWINLAFSDSALHQRDHLRVLQAVSDSLSTIGARLSGGHSTEGAESHLAIVANGELKPETQWSKSGIHAGDVLLLSKSLGSGVILAADMQGEADAETVDAAYQTMLQSNHAAMQLLLSVQPHAVTDVTGFGLIGHLLEMLDGAAAKSGQALIAELALTSIPIIPGALELAKAGWRSSLYPQLQHCLQRCSLDSDLATDLATDGQHRAIMLELLIDPQTSGGLLAALPAPEAQTLLKTGDEFVAIGRIAKRQEDAVDVVDIQII